MIFIRLVQGGRNEQSRFTVAFKDVPVDQWSTFTNAYDLPRKLYNDPDNGSNIDTANQASIPLTSVFSIILSLLATVYIETVFI